MTLPNVSMPTYAVNLPSSGQTIRVRPFKVKEEKLLLMASESDKASEIVDTVKQVLSGCIVKGDVEIDKLPFFDVDFLFIFLRAKSIGESVEVNLTCNNTLEDGNRCGHTFPTAMDISNCEIVKDDTVSNKIELDRSSGAVLKYPSYALMKYLDQGTELDKKTAIIVNSIDHIYDKKGVYSSKDYSTKELVDFVESLTKENYKKLENFVDNFPTFVVKLEADCPKCKFHHEVRYSDFQDFFY